MAKGSVGVSLGSSLVYRYQLKSGTKNCKNCVNYKKRGDPLKYERKYGRCKKFQMLITDTTNARVCKAFLNKDKRYRPKKTSTPKVKEEQGK